MEQFSDIVTSIDRLTEGYEFTCMLKDMPTRIDVDSEWFFLPKEWLDKWEVYNFSDVVTATPGQPNEELRSVDRTKPPGRIDFSGLFLPKEDNQLADISLQFLWQNFQVKKGLREGVDFIFVTKTIMEKFLAKYGSVQSDAMKSYMRFGVE